MRVLGKGKTAFAIKECYSKAILYDDHDLEAFDSQSDELTVVSPGIPPNNELVQNTKNLISEYDLFKEVMPYSIWISGTNGKTTTTAMLQHLLECKGSVSGGNIGTPLANLNSDANIWILETSSFTLHYTSMAKPNIYILLPISEDHTSWHGSFEKYEKSKLKPLDGLKEGEVTIIPSKYKDYPTCGYKICYDSTLDLAQYFDIDVSKLNFKEPFLLDAILALAVSKVLFDEVDYNKINQFKQDSHKLEEFKDNRGRIWVDDSKATNIDATIQALKGYCNKHIFLILGGDDKGANLIPLFDQLTNHSVTIFAIGKNSKKIIELSKQYSIACHNSYTLENAVSSISKKLGKDNSIALLSPAAASIDQYSSYKHRGEVFKKLVFNLS
jgi:UDP-N-acetylmuramoylalanine--D-glutamate ligase